MKAVISAGKTAADVDATPTNKMATLPNVPSAADGLGRTWEIGECGNFEIAQWIFGRRQEGKREGGKEGQERASDRPTQRRREQPPRGPPAGAAAQDERKAARVYV
jgi:hypothetical protein